MVLKQLTLDEKIDLLHGNGMPGWGASRSAECLPRATAVRALCSAFRGWAFL